MKSGSKLIAFILFLALILVLVSKPTSAVISPNGSYCLDRSGVLDERTIDYITERNHNLEANCSGAQICVVVLKTTGGDRIEDYARKLFKEWAIGAKDEDNGALLLMATDDRDYVIIPGKGLEKVLTTAVLTDINRDYIENYFDAGDYDNAVREGFRKLNDTVCGHYGADPYGFAGGSGFSGGGSGRPGGGKNGSCASITLPSFSCGQLSLAACGACIGMELLSSIGGD